MTDTTDRPDIGQPNRLRVSWQEWQTLHAVVTRAQPAAGPYHVTVVETFTDGRVFGLARLLRDRLGFEGDLEVSGDFLPDQISFLERCGVNAFSGEEIVRDAFNHYSGFYQPPRPGIDEVHFIRDSRKRA